MIPENERTRLYESVFEQVRSLLKNSDGCHDFDHTLRVLKNARMLAEEENCADTEILMIELAALLHDCARPEEFASEGKICHARLGAENAGTAGSGGSKTQVPPQEMFFS